MRLPLENAVRAYTSIHLRINPIEKDKKLQALNNALLDALKKVKSLGSGLTT